MSGIGEVVDKLATINNKLFLSQEIVYVIRHMSFEQYKKEYFETEDGAKKLWDGLKKCCDQNVERNFLIQEFDAKLVEIIKSLIQNKDEEQFIQKANKTY